METSLLIATIGVLSGVITYLYRQQEALKSGVVKQCRDDLAIANATIESLRAEIRVLRNNDDD